MRRCIIIPSAGVGAESGVDLAAPRPKSPTRQLPLPKGKPAGAVSFVGATVGESDGITTAGDGAPETAPAPAVAATPSPPLWMAGSSGGAMEESLHRRMLRAFHACVFGRRRVFVIPRMGKAAVEFYTRSLGLLPRLLHGRELRDYAEGEEDYSEDFGYAEPYAIQDGFGRGPEWSRASSLGVLADFNSLGYDIQTPVNPTTCKIRGQRAVAVCMNVLADGDDWDLERQLAALAGFRGEIAAITESGRRGVHAVFRLRRPFPNPHRLHWREARRAQQGSDLRANLPEFREAAGALRERLRAAGFEPDGMIVDHSVLTRLPGFRHGGTGKTCRLLYLNRSPWSGRPPDRVYLHPDVKAVWDRPTAVVVGDPLALSGSAADPLASAAPSVDPLVPSSSVTESPVEEGLFDGVGGLCGEDAGSADAVGSVGGAGALVQEACGCGRDVVPVNVYTSPSEAAPRRPNRRDFLADWETYQSLKAQGVPARHHRHRLHIPMFGVATVMGWSDETLAGEWRRIVSIHPANIGYDADRAVSDLLGGWAARGRKENIRLPDIARLPRLGRRQTGNPDAEPEGRWMPPPIARRSHGGRDGRAHGADAMRPEQGRHPGPEQQGDAGAVRLPLRRRQRRAGEGRAAGRGRWLVQARPADDAVQGPLGEAADPVRVQVGGGLLAVTALMSADAGADLPPTGSSVAVHD
jgi:hypothetical protein